MTEEREPMGNAKAQIIEKRDGGTFEVLKLSISPDFLALINSWATDHKNWANIDIMQRREPSPKGYTHYAKLNTHEKKKEEGTQRVTLAQANDMPSDGCPF